MTLHSNTAGLSQLIKRGIIIAHDLVATAFAFGGCLILRYQFWQLAPMMDEVVWLMPVFVGIAAIVYRVFPLYASKWRFASLPDLFNIFKAASVLAIVMLIGDYVMLARNMTPWLMFGREDGGDLLAPADVPARRPASRLPLSEVRAIAPRERPRERLERRDPRPAPRRPRSSCARWRRACGAASRPARSCRRNGPTTAPRSAACRCSAIMPSSSASSPRRRTATSRSPASSSRRTSSFRRPSPRCCSRPQTGSASRSRACRPWRKARPSTAR